MIFSRIDHNFSIYKKGQCFLFGASVAGYKIKKTLQNLNIHISAFVDNDEHKIGTKFDGIDIISFDELKSRIQSEKYIIQISSSFYEDEIAEQLNSIGADYILYSEWNQRLKIISRQYLVKREPGLREFIFQEDWNHALNSCSYSTMRYLYENTLENKKEFNLFFASPKTGGTTLVFSCVANLIRWWDSYVYIDDNVSEFIRKSKVNLIIGIRDAVAQNISLMYEDVSMGRLWDVDQEDVQKVFDNYIIGNSTENCFYLDLKKRLKSDRLVQDFFEQQLEPFFGVNIYNYPFDKERGYSIYEIGNINIMIYQVEKMNLLEKEIGEFLNIDNFKLKHGNIAEEKWYKDYYNRCKKEIKLTEEYFDSCYSGKYMNHFYSEEDIEKFKRKWVNNIQK